MCNLNWLNICSSDSEHIWSASMLQYAVPLLLYSPDKCHWYGTVPAWKYPSVPGSLVRTSLVSSWCRHAWSHCFKNSSHFVWNIKLWDGWLEKIFISGGAEARPSTIQPNAITTTFIHTCDYLCDDEAKHLKCKCKNHIFMNFVSRKGKIFNMITFLCFALQYRVPKSKSAKKWVQGSGAVSINLTWGQTYQ